MFNSYEIYNLQSYSNDFLCVHVRNSLQQCRTTSLDHLRDVIIEPREGTIGLQLISIKGLTANVKKSNKKLIPYTSYFQVFS